MERQTPFSGKGTVDIESKMPCQVEEKNENSPFFMSPAEVGLTEYTDVKSRLAEGNLAGWLVNKLEDRQIQLGLTLADNLVELKLKEQKT